MRSLLAACAISALLVTAGAASAAERTIAVLQALTGPGAFAGVPLADGMKFAAKQLNAQKFLGEDTISLVVADSASDRTQSMSSVSRFANDPKILAVLGPTTAGEAVPAAAVANDLKIPMFAMTLAGGVRAAGPWSFSGPQAGPVTMPPLADYVMNRLQAKSCAMIHLSDSEAHVDLARVFRDHAEPKGLKFVEYAHVKTSETDYSALSTRVVSLKPDCVLIFTFAPNGANLVMQLKQAGLDPKAHVVGQTALASPQFTEIGGKAVDGVVFNADWAPGGTTPEAKAFADAYRKETGQEADNYVALGYSYMQVMATAIRKAGPNPTREAIRAALTETKNVPVVAGTGLYSFDDKRASSYGVSFVVVKDGKFVAAD